MAHIIMHNGSFHEFYDHLRFEWFMKERKKIKPRQNTVSLFYLEAKLLDFNEVFFLNSRVDIK